MKREGANISVVKVYSKKVDFLKNLFSFFSQDLGWFTCGCVFTLQINAFSSTTFEDENSCGTCIGGVGVGRTVWKRNEASQVGTADPFGNIRPDDFSARCVESTSFTLQAT